MVCSFVQRSLPRFGLALFSLTIVVLASGEPVLAQNNFNPRDFNLRPGEILVAVDGVPVQASTSALPSVSAGVSSRPVAASAAMQSRPGQPVQVPQFAAPMPAGRSGLIVNRDPQAYAHALREAQILASRGENYHRHGDGGHPLGVAPGCRFSGTGYSRDPNRPNHCYQGELPDSRLVARAMVPGPNGTYYWSAHYR